MQRFVSEAQHSMTSTSEKKLVEKEDDSSSELIEEDMDVLLIGITELDFKDPRL